MAEIIGLVIFLLCLAIWIGLSIRGAANEKKRIRARKESLAHQDRIESRIQKIEGVYGETATVIHFRKQPVLDIADLLVVLEDAQVLLLLGEAYNFSEILNIKIGMLDYVRLKHTISATTPTHILQRAATGEFTHKRINETSALLRNALEDETSEATAQSVRVDVMTSRLQHPVISIYPTTHSLEEVVAALSIIIDKNEHK